MTDASGREAATFHIPAEADLQACTCGNELSGTDCGNGLSGRASGTGFGKGLSGADIRKRYAGNRPAGLIPSAEKGFCRISKYIYLCNEMITQDDIFRITDDAAFEAAALKVFRRQAAECPPYREYLALAGVQPEEVRAAREIPFLPIEIFKTHDVYCGGTEPEAVFTSSATTGMTPSRHPMRSLALYERTFRAAFRTFYGEPGQWSLYALLPNYLRRKGSSLVYMADRLIADCGSGGFYLDDYDALLAAMQADPKPKILLGVSYALWDLAERYAPKLENTVIMETGGMKGYREEIPKEEFHKILCGAFGVGAIHSEYGMAELTSQAYSQGGNLFRCPPWMRVTTRDVNDPFDPQPAGTRGGLNIADLANWWSCAFIQTQDVGRVDARGAFVVEGRIDHSDIRGCNLLVQ